MAEEAYQQMLHRLNALEARSAALEQQNQALHQQNQSLSNLAQNSQLTSDAVQRLVELADRPSAVGTHIKVPTPEKYDGTRSASQLFAWLFAVQTYVTASYPGKPHQQVLAASLLLTGMAATWFRYQISLSPFLDFAGFESRLKIEFLPANYLSQLRDELAACRQARFRSVAEYTAAFQNVLLQLPDVSDTEARSRYMQGLRDRTRNEVEWKEPKTLQEAVQLASRFEAIMGRSRHADTAATSENAGPVPMDLSRVEIRNGNPFRRPSASTSGFSTNNPFRPSTPTRLTPQARQWCLDNSACFYCRAPNAGHTVGTCPQRRAVPPARLPQSKN